MWRGAYYTVTTIWWGEKKHVLEEICSKTPVFLRTISSIYQHIRLEQFLSRSPSGFHLFTYFTVWSPWVSSSLNWRVRAGFKFAITRARMVKAWTRISGWWPFKLSANPKCTCKSIYEVSLGFVKPGGGNHWARTRTMYCRLSKPWRRKQFRIKFERWW